MTDLIPEGYDKLITDLKQRISTAQIKAALSVNRDLIQLYWGIGKELLARQQEAQWGDKVLERLSQDLRAAFPEMKGFSKTNLKYMKRFAESYPAIGQQAVDQLPWGHNIALMTKLKDPEMREWYTKACIEFGWSRAVLEMQIETRLHERQGSAPNNFQATLPKPQSDLARQVLKDPYNFDFLSLHDAAVERDLENGLLNHLKDFMLELGVGFAFVGNQFHLDVAGDDFYIDLLFYHLKLRCFVVIELKMTAFKPEYVGKLNFYLSAVDDIMKHSSDEPSIGILLCKTKNDLVVEYALKDMSKPMGIAEYQLGESLPETLKDSLPSIEDIEAELEKVEPD